MATFAKFVGLAIGKTLAPKCQSDLLFATAKKKCFHWKLMHFFCSRSFSRALRVPIVFLPFSEAFYSISLSFHCCFTLPSCEEWESHSRRKLFLIDLLPFLVLFRSLSVSLHHSLYVPFHWHKGRPAAWITNKSFVALTDVCLWLPLSGRLLFIAFVDAKCQVDSFNWISVAVTQFFSSISVIWY